MALATWDEIKAQIGYEDLSTEDRLIASDKYADYFRKYYTEVEPQEAQAVDEAASSFIYKNSDDELGSLNPVRRGAQFFAGIGRGLFDSASSSIKGVALAQQMIGEKTGAYADNDPVTERDAYQIGRDLDEFAKSAFGLEDPRLRNDFLNTLFPEAIGTALGFATAGGVAAGTLAVAAPAAAAAPIGFGLTGATAAASLATGALGTLQQGQQGYEEAKQYGADEGTARLSALINAPLGATEAIPFASQGVKLAGKFAGGLSGGALRSVFKTFGKDGILQGVAKTAAEESLQEGFQQLGGNIIAQNLYDPNRGTLEGVGTAMALGGLVGGTIGGGVNAIVRDNESFYADELGKDIEEKTALASAAVDERREQILYAARNAYRTSESKVNLETGEETSTEKSKTVFGDRLGGDVPDIGENPALNSVPIGRDVRQDKDGTNIETITYHTPMGLLWEAEFKSGQPIAVRDVTDTSPTLQPLGEPQDPATARALGRGLKEEFGLETEGEMDRRLIDEATRRMQSGVEGVGKEATPINQLETPRVPERDDAGVARQEQLVREIDRLYRLRDSSLAKQILTGQSPDAGSVGDGNPNTAVEVIKYDNNGRVVQPKAKPTQLVSRLNTMIAARERELRGLKARPESYIYASVRNQPPSYSQRAALVQGYERLWNSITSPQLRKQIEMEVGNIDEAAASMNLPLGAVAYYRKAIQGRKEMIFLSDKLATNQTVTREMLHELGHSFWHTLPAGIQSKVIQLWKAETGSRTGVLFEEGGALKPEVSPYVMTSPQEFFSERLSWSNDNWAKGRTEASGVMQKTGNGFRSMLDRFLRYTGHGERLNLEFKTFLNQGDRFAASRDRSVASFVAEGAQSGFDTGLKREVSASVRGMLDFGKIYDFVKSNEGGFTVDPVQFRMPQSGFVVAPSKKTEDSLVYEIEAGLGRDGMIKALRSYLLSQEDLIKGFGFGKELVGVDGRGAFFGGWRKTEENGVAIPQDRQPLVIDMSFILDKKEDALYLAENGEQEAIFDISAGVAIDTAEGISQLRAGGVYSPNDRGRLQELGGQIDYIAGRKGSFRTAADRIGRTIRPANNQAADNNRTQGVPQEGSPEVAASARGSRSLNLSPQERGDLGFWVSQRIPDAVKRTEDGLSSDLVIGLDAILSDKTLAAKQADYLRRYIGWRTEAKTDEDVIRDFSNHIKANLLYLYDSYDPNLRQRAKQWYQGGRKIADEWASKYGYTTPQVAAVIASLSPRANWFVNLTMAERLIDIHNKSKDKPFTEAMMKEARKFLKPFQYRAVKNSIGKTYAQLTSNFEKAIFIRVYDQTNNDRSYYAYSPEGSRLGKFKTKAGEDAKTAWTSFGFIAKGVSVLENGSRENISKILGGEHKVRNFYNNILLPNLSDFGDVTIDTHAVAAGLLRPLSGNDFEVGQALGVGAPSSSLTGVSGMYGVYADAYRNAAAERGVLPREMQSITWEAVRGLFKPTFKNAKNKALINNTWKEYSNGEATADNTRQRISSIAGGIERPSWAVSDSGVYDPQQNSANTGELFGSGLAGQEAGGRVGRRVSSVPSDSVSTAANVASPSTVPESGVELSRRGEQSFYPLPFQVFNKSVDENPDLTIPASVLGGENPKSLPLNALASLKRAVAFYDNAVASGAHKPRIDEKYGRIIAQSIIDADKYAGDRGEAYSKLTKEAIKISDKRRAYRSSLGYIGYSSRGAEFTTVVHETAHSLTTDKISFLRAYDFATEKSNRMTRIPYNKALEKYLKSDNQDPKIVRLIELYKSTLKQLNLESFYLRGFQTKSENNPKFGIEIRDEGSRYVVRARGYLPTPPASRLQEGGLEFRPYYGRNSEYRIGDRRRQKDGAPEGINSKISDLQRFIFSTTGTTVAYKWTERSSAAVPKSMIPQGRDPIDYIKTLLGYAGYRDVDFGSITRVDLKSMEDIDEPQRLVIVDESEDFSKITRNKPLASAEADTTVFRGGDYALGNLDEFIAAAFSSANAQAVLKTLKGDGQNKSLWQSLVDAIRELLGLSTDNTMLESIMDASYDLAGLRKPQAATIVDVSDQRPSMAEATGQGGSRAPPEVQASTRGESSISLDPSVAASTRGEQAQRLLEPVISFGRQQLRTGGALPNDIFRIGEQRGFRINEKMMRANNAVTDLEAAVKAATGKPMSKLDDKEVQRLNEALSNPAVRVRMAPQIAAAVGNARNLIDSLTSEMVRIGAVPEHLIPVFEANKGVYVTRAYEKWENPNYKNPFDTLPKEVRNKIESTVKSWMENKYANAYAKEQSLARGESGIDPKSPAFMADLQAGLNKARSNGISKSEIRGYIDYLASPEDSPFGLLGSGLTKDLSIVTPRKEIPAEIRQLWGEIKDPRVNILNSVQRMAAFLETHQMLRDMKDAGMNKIFFSTPRQGFSTRIVTDGSRTASPLNMFVEGMRNDIYTSEEIADALRYTFGGRSRPESAIQKLGEFYLKANGISKFAKTVLSVQTQVRNVLGNAQFLVANGYIFSPDGAIALQKLRELALPVAGTTLGISRDKAMRDYAAKLSRLGIVGQGFFANEMQSYFKDANVNTAINFYDNYLMRAVKTVGKVATSAYQLGDQIPKVIAFEVELARLRRAFPSTPASRLEVMAADKVLNLLPTYSRIPRLGNTLRSQPFLGSFISFPLEVVRTGYNLIGTINEELRSENPEIRKTGAYRLVGSLVATVGFTAAASAIATAMGIDDEEDKAIRQLDAPWDKYSTKLYLGRDDKGNVQQVNLSYVDPYNYFRDPLIALAKADGSWEQRLLEAVKTGFEPLYGEQILTGKILDITRNKKGTTGGRVYNPEGSLFDRSAAISAHMFEAFNIGTVTSGLRIYKGLRGEVTQTGRAYDPALETLAVVTGQRVVTLDPRQGLSFTARRFNNRINDATGVFTATYYDRSKITEEGKLNAYKGMMDSRKDIFLETGRTVNAAMRLGVSRGEVLKILREQGVSQQSALALVSGTVAPYNPRDRAVRSDVEAIRRAIPAR